jgi:hypothetical protein
MERHEFERIRRSLAMSPSLPTDIAQELVAALGRILHDRAALAVLAEDLERVAADLRRLAR